MSKFNSIRRESRRRFWPAMAALAFLALGFLSGCALLYPSPDGIKKEPGIGACDSDSDCLRGQTCFLGDCKSQGNDDKQRISLQLLPSNSHSFRDPNTAISKQQFVGIEPAKVHNKTIQARVAFTIQGEVYRKNPTFNEPDQKKAISSKIRFIDKDSIQGQTLAWEVSTDPGQTSLSRYQHRLSYGLYTVEIWPRDEHLPPHRLQLRVKSIEKDGKLSPNTPQTHNFELPQEKEYPHIKGRLVSSGSPSTSMGGLKIQAMSKDGYPISKVFVTSEQGTFDIWLAKGENPHVIRVQQQTTPSLHPQLDIPFPRTSIPAPGEQIDLGDLAVGLKTSTIKVQGVVRARLQDGGHPSPNTHIRIIGEIDTGSYKDKSLKGSYIVNVRSDSSGHYKAELPPGKYHFEVIPPADSDRSRAYIVPTKSYFHNDREMDLDLSPKRRIVGKVCEKAEDGTCLKKLPNAQIQALWRSPLPQNQERLSIPQLPSIPTTPFRTVISQNDGSYEITLDPGYYDFVYIPSKGSGLARLIRPNVEINNNDVNPHIQLDGLLPKAKHLIGQILDNGRYPISNITVEMYSHSTDKQSAQLLGRAITNSQGFFSIPYHTK